MKVLIAGATGFVGQAIVDEFKAHDHAVSGLAHSDDAHAQLETLGIGVVNGDLLEAGDLIAKLEPFDVVILAAGLPFEKELDAVAELIEGSAGRDQRIIFTSGTGVLSIAAEEGQWSEHSFAEDDPFDFPDRHNRAVRIKTEALVRAAATDALRTNVIRPPLIWGRAGGHQVQRVFQSAKERGAAWYVGHGLNLYSNVHVEDLARLYRIVAERGEPGALYHAVAGEANFRSIAEAVAQVMGVEARSVTYDEACDLWGQTVVDIAHVTNSRSRSPRSHDELGWEATRLDLLEDIRNGSYAKHYTA